MNDDVSNKPDLTVLTCTHNPRRDVLEKVLDALSSQTLNTSRWEYIIVDNNCDDALEQTELNDRQNLPMRILRESCPGLAAARRRGIREASADLLVMVDDDNILDPDYLETALAIARSETALGAFGGVVRPHLETGVVRKWQHRLLGYLGVRDFGQSVITSNQDHWGEWEPIGAGMVVRKEVADKFIDLIDNIPLANRLGHNGNSLLAGDDSLIARAAYRVGYSCSYQPRLKLTHFIKRPRMRIPYLVRLLFGQGRSTVILNSVLGIPSAKLGIRELFQRFRHRCSQDGLGGAIIWAWDVGYFIESRSRLTAQTQEKNMATDKRRGAQIPNNS
jgi:glycosyltransferase involved in cell wall biosynthesis